MRKRYRLLFILGIVLAVFGGAKGVGGGVLPECGCQGQPDLGLTNPPTRGAEVEELQEYLAKMGFFQGRVDGVYDEKTAAAVTALQGQLGLPETGKMCPRTWAYLAWAGERPALGQPEPPPEGEVSVLVDVDALILILYVDGEPFKIYPVAIGRWSSPTPLGEWRVVEKFDVWSGPFGARWLGLDCPWGSYGIHGTDNPSSIGWEASSGCIRMFNQDVIELFEWVPYDTPVRIIGSRLRTVSVPEGLGLGDMGQRVVPLQLRLRELGYAIGQADGVFGKVTQQAVQELQAFFRLKADGEVDSLLLYLLGLSGEGEG